MASDDPRFDGLLLNIAQQQQDGIDGLLGAFFGFLRRKTDFFTGQPSDVVKQTLLKAIERQMAIVERTQAASKPQGQAPKVVQSPEIVELGTDGEFDASSAPAPPAAAASASAGSDKPPAMETVADKVVAGEHGASPGVFMLFFVRQAPDHNPRFYLQRPWETVARPTSTPGPKRCKM